MVTADQRLLGATFLADLDDFNADNPPSDRLVEPNLDWSMAMDATKCLGIEAALCSESEQAFAIWLNNAGEGLMIDDDQFVLPLDEKVETTIDELLAKRCKHRPLSPDDAAGKAGIDESKEAIAYRNQISRHEISPSYSAAWQGFGGGCRVSC